MWNVLLAVEHRESDADNTKRLLRGG
jgi:hypothetical protein